MKKHTIPNYSYIYKPIVNRNLKIEAKEEFAVDPVKKDIVKSLILISLILGLELVIYLAWSKFMP